MKLLDLFCGAGGAAMGYHRAGFSEIVGVDIVQQPRYPFQFVRGDALEYLTELIKSGEISEFAMIHASPPCQGYSRATKHLSNGHHQNLIPETRQLLNKTSLPYVIENVPGAPCLNPIVLCGSMFGLPLIRHRLFECNPTVWFPPAVCRCSHLYTNSKTSAGQLSAFGRGATAISVAGSIYLKSDGEIAMGIDWMTKRELSQAIPPAYTEWIGRQLLSFQGHTTGGQNLAPSQKEKTIMDKRIIMTSPVVTAQPCGCCKYGAVVYPCAIHHEGMPKERPDTMKHLPPWVWNDKSVGELLREKNKEIKNV